MNSGMIAVLLVVAIVAGAGAGYLVGVNVSGNQTSQNTVTASIASRIASCGSPGVYCGGIGITSASLTVNGNYSVLQVTVVEIGNSVIGSATVYVNGTVIGIPPAAEYEPPGNIILNVTSAQPAVLVLTIPGSTIPIHAGMTYSVLVYGWLGSSAQGARAGDQATVNIKAN